MSTEENKYLFRRFVEAINAGNLNFVDEVISPSFISHEKLPPGIPSGREGVKQMFSMLRNAFPDLNATIEDEIAEGDKVVCRLTFTGTHKGEFMGVPPSGRKINYAVIDIVRITNGQIAEHWGVSDDLGLMQQISGEGDLVR